ncbi:hypothetical protein EVA_21418, partial [gut metagenome]
IFCKIIKVTENQPLDLFYHAKYY